MLFVAGTLEALSIDEIGAFLPLKASQNCTYCGTSANKPIEMVIGTSLYSSVEI